jgi:phage terminase large subunit
MSRRLNLKTAEVFRPLVPPARYKGAWGGRGGAKSNFFAELMVEYALANPGFRGVCIREIQLTLRDSSKRLIEDKIAAFDAWGNGFESLHDRIVTPGGGSIVFIGMQDANAESVKSLEGIDIAWVEEAQTLSERSLMLLRPTIRKDGSELWFSWNARRANDPVDAMLRSATPPTGAVVVNANWRDNPWFPSALEQERQDCLRIDPDQYGHIWEGEYVRILKGAYYASQLTAARADNRLDRDLVPEPLLGLTAYIDIGGTGAKSDAFAMWIVQQVRSSVRVLDYYEAQGQPLATHVAWLREKGYRPHFVLPHDGVTHDRMFKVSAESLLTAAGYRVTVIRNQGAGAAAARIAALRRLFPRIHFDRKARGGVEALAWYHEKRDETRGIGLGPEHDHSSHAADAAGLMAIHIEAQPVYDDWSNPLDYSQMDLRCA